MDTKFEHFVRKIFHSEIGASDDKLSCEINGICEDELTQDELEYVSAAGSGYFEKFKSSYIDKK